MTDPSAGCVCATEDGESLAEDFTVSYVTSDNIVVGVIRPGELVSPVDVDVLQQEKENPVTETEVTVFEYFGSLFQHLVAAGSNVKSRGKKPKTWKKKEEIRPNKYKPSNTAMTEMIESISDGIAKVEGTIDGLEEFRKDLSQEERENAIQDPYLRVLNVYGEWMEEKEIVVLNPLVNPMSFSLDVLKKYCLENKIDPTQQSLKVSDYLVSHNLRHLHDGFGLSAIECAKLVDFMDKPATPESEIVFPGVRTFDEYMASKRIVADNHKIRKVETHDIGEGDVVVGKVKPKIEVVHKNVVLRDIPLFGEHVIKLYPIYLSKYKDISSSRVAEEFDVHGKFTELDKASNIQYNCFVNDRFRVLLDTDRIVGFFGPFVSVYDGFFGIPRDPVVAYKDVFDSLGQAMGQRFFGVKSVYDIEAITKWFAASLEKEGILHWRQRIGDLRSIVENQILTEGQRRMMFLMKSRNQITDIKIDQYCFSTFFTTEAAEDAAACCKDYLHQTFLSKLLYGLWGLGSLAAFFLPGPVKIIYTLGVLNFGSYVYAVRRLAYGRSILYGMVIDTLVVKACNFSIPATCSDGISTKPLRSGAKISPYPKNLVCSQKEFKPYGCIIDGATLVIPKGCAHDLHNALTIRFLFDRSFSPVFVDEFVRFSKEWLVMHLILNTQYKSFRDYVQHLPSRRRQPMLLNEDGLTHAQMYISNLFVKIEAYLGKTADAFKPRMIHCRQDEFQALVGSYFWAFSKWLSDLFDLHHRLTYDSDLTATELGVKALQCAAYGDLYEVDVSNWDGSMLNDFLCLERWLIDNLPEQPPAWHIIRQHWTSVSGKSNIGVNFSCDWGRRSGDSWTSSLNSLLNILITLYVFDDPDLIGVFKGDDNFVGAKTKFTTEQLIERYAALGLTAKLKAVNLDTLEYCSGRFYDLGHKLKWGVKPFRVLSKFGINTGRHPATIGARLNRGTAISLLPICAHVPVIGPFMVALATDDSARPLFHEARSEWQTSDCEIDFPTEITYQNFSALYGIDLAEIYAIEVILTQLCLKDLPCILYSEVLLQGSNHDNDNPLDHYDPHYQIIDEPKEVFHDVDDFQDINTYVVPLLEECVKYSIYTAFGGSYFGIMTSSFLVALAESLLREETFVPLWALHFSFPSLGLLVSQVAKPYDFTFVFGALFHIIWNIRALSSIKKSRETGKQIRKKARQASCVTIVKKGSKMRNAVPSKSAKGVTPKKNKNNKSKESGVSKKEVTLIGKAMRAAGSLGGEFVGGPMGARLGEKAMSWLSKITGQGDYKVEENTLGGGGVPSFSPEKHGIRVCHKEFLTNVSTSTSFNISQSLLINPGNSVTFPWLSNIAQNFEEYEINGLVFVYNPTSSTSLNSTNPAQGVVVMATHYNVLRPPFVDKLTMESYEFSCSAAPYRALAHPVECKPAQNVLQRLFVRTADTTAFDDPRFYDLGRFELATEGMQAVYTAGELWVTYDVTFFKPRLSARDLTFKVVMAAPSAAAPIDSSTGFSGDLPITATNVGSGQQIDFDLTNCPPGDYEVYIYTTNSVAAVTSSAGSTYTNLTVASDCFFSTSTFRIGGPVSGETASSGIQLAYFTVGSDDVTKTFRSRPVTYASGTMTNMIVTFVKLPKRPNGQFRTLSDAQELHLFDLGKGGKKLFDLQEMDEKLGDPDLYVAYLKTPCGDVTRIRNLNVTPVKVVTVMGRIEDPEELWKLSVDFELI